MRRLALAATVLTLTLAACGQQSLSTQGSTQTPATGTEGNLPTLDGAQTVATQPQATEPYNITLRFVGNPSQTFKDAANAAARRWERALTAGVADVRFSSTFSPSQQCGATGAANISAGTVVDDIMIDVGVTSIDGAGNILAESGPCLTRSSGGLTIYGSLIFDSADVNSFSSQLQSILIHEMGHSLGIGTLWQSKGKLSGAGTSNPTFTGTNAVREWHALGGTGNVPVENTGGAGTRDGHWRETTFKNELMTGFINTGTNPLSRMSIASLADLGYSVNLGAADAYSLPVGAASAQASGIETGEQLVTPRFQVQ